MNFIHPYFLAFLPLIVIPLLLSLIARLNRKKQPFPSIELLQDIVSHDRTARKLLIRLKQIVRALVIALVVLAFAQPFFGGGAFGTRPGKRTVAIIDNTLSMSRFDLNSLVRFLSGEWSIDRIYFGDDLLRQEGQERYAIDAVQLEEMVRLALLKEGANLPDSLVLVSDGQSCNYHIPIPIPSSVRSLHFVKPFLNKDFRNLFVKSISTFPGVLFPGENAEFLAEIGGPEIPGGRVRIFINNKEIFSERTSGKIAFSRMLEGNWLKPGLNTGMVLLEGDDLTNDNRFYFPVLSQPVPAVYSDIDSPVIHKIFSSIFPEFTVADIPDAASVVFTGRDLNIGRNKPVLLFCEDIKTTESILRKEFHEFAEFNNDTAEGNMVSSDPALSMVQGVSIKTKYRLRSADHLEAGTVNTPLFYRYDNKALFTFSVKENQDYFADSPSLLLMADRFLMDFYRGVYLVPDNDPAMKNKRFFDENGSPADVRFTAGVLKDKDGGKSIIHNASEESEGDYLSEKELRKKISGIPQGRIAFHGLDTERTSPVYPGFLTGIILMLIAAGLAFLEVL